MLLFKEKQNFNMYTSTEITIYANVYLRYSFAFKLVYKKIQLRSDNIIPFQFDKYITFGFLSVFNALIHGYVSLKPRHDRGFNFPFQAKPDYFNKSLFL